MAWTKSGAMFGVCLMLAVTTVQAQEPPSPPPATTAGTAPRVAIANRGELPLWEIGIGLAAAGSPDYPGSDRTRARALPLPYGIYRGKTLFESDRPARGPLNFSPTVELDVSFGGALPASSRGNAVREGMPDLDLLLEAGPQLSILLARPSRSTAITLAMPLRAVFSVSTTDVSARGIVFNPELSYTNGKFAGRGWSTRVSLGTTAATEQLQDYFYEVSPRFATPARPAYDAGGGYLETSLTTVFSRAFVNDVSLFAFLRLSSQQNSSNRSSPLLRDDSNASFGIGVAYTFLRSERMVSKED